MPGIVNWWLKLVPEFKVPLSNKLASLVTVCEIPSLFVHLIVVFAITEMVEGLKLEFVI